MTGLTLKILDDMMNQFKDIPLVPFLASARVFPADHAIKFTVDRRDYVGAHPSFWSKIPTAARPFPGTFDTVVYDLDAVQNTNKRAEFFKAFATATAGIVGSR